MNFNAKQRPRFPRRFRRRMRPLWGPVVWAPIINVVLLVWLFLVVNSEFVLQPGIELILPAAQVASGAPYQPAVLAITQDELLFFNDQRILRQELNEVLRRSAEADPHRTLLLEADGRVRHQSLVRLYTIAAEAGFQKIVLATRPIQPPP